MTDAGETDPHEWLEDVEGDRALDWVRERNVRTEEVLFADERFTQLRDALLAILEADDRIPLPTRHRDDVLNFWTDRDHRRGLLRRTTWAEYERGDPEWEIVLDVDALSRSEGESWVYHGGATRRPDRRRVLLDLSPGGSDASTTREFDLAAKDFVSKEDGAFIRPVAKGWVEWIDDDTIYVGNDFGPETLTASGYPRTIRRWTRGTPLADAPVVFEGEPEDVSVHVSVSTFPGYLHHVFSRSLDFYNRRHWILRDGDLVEIETPHHAEVSVRGPYLLVYLRSDWSVGDGEGGQTFPAGALLAADLDAFLRGSRDIEVVFEPTPATALSSYVWTRDHLVLTIQEHVRDRIEICTPASGWERRPLANAPDVWSLTAWPVDADERNDVFLVGMDFVTPSTLFLADIDAETTEVLRTSPHRFDASDVTIEQRFATSADGTRVPYFFVSRPGDGPKPLLLNAYGGFEVANTATYSALVGHAWLEKGGTYVLANIRGGGEYGPAWHQAGLRENRHRVYEDHEAVARDLIDRGDTTPELLGIIGGSNGGLLVGNMYVRCPELYGAVVCQVPLLDMKRYSHLLAGASWVAEYGDPDVPEDWEFIKTFSPYHLVRPDVRYPPILLATSTRDDRVHPGHARKMAALLEHQEHDVTYWENIEGGHGMAADATQQATMWALAYTFLYQHLFRQ